MKNLARLRALAPPRVPPFPTIPPRAAALHTTTAARRPDDPNRTTGQTYKATIVEDDDSPAPAKKPASSSSSSTSSKSSASSSASSSSHKQRPHQTFFEDDEPMSTDPSRSFTSKSSTAYRPTVLSRLEHAAEDINDAEQRGERLRAEAEILSADAKAAADPPPAVALPPRKTWATAAEKVAEEDEDYVPAEDYARLPKVGGLENWFDQKGRWGGRVRPAKKTFFGPSADQRRQKDWYWNDVVKRALAEAVEEREGIARRVEVEKNMGVGPWMEGVVLDDLLLKFAICKRVYRDTGFKVPDAKLHSIRTLFDLYSLMAGPPPAQTLYQSVAALVQPGRRFDVPAANVAAKEVLAGKPRVMTKGPALMRLPNVRMLPRPLTEVQREREIGRWKEIQKQWLLRGLPTGKRLTKIEKGSEKAWAWGKP